MSEQNTLIKCAESMINDLPESVAKKLLLNASVGLSMISKGEVGNPPPSSPPLVVLHMLRSFEDELSEDEQEVVDAAMEKSALMALDFLIAKMGKKSSKSANPEAANQ